MKISELSRRTGVTVATIKYYIREGLLPAGTPVTVTTADYDAAHVDRLRLIRALVDIGQLSITTVGELLAALDREEAAQPTANGRTTNKARAAAVRSAVTATHDALAAGAPPISAAPERALAAMAALGWTVDPKSSALGQLETALAGLDAVLLPPSEATLRAYGGAALAVAEADSAGTPAGSPAEIVRHTVIGTVLYEPVLIALRRLAQEELVGRSRSQR
jgi:DNA-binding transcriptional MerR regulator